MAEKEPIQLPAKYYLDYFQFLLGFVEEKSGHLLGSIGSDFISSFKSLSENAQCLAIRMANRKGEYYRLSKFNYEEIENIGEATEELVESDFVSLDPPNDPLLFRLFTKGELMFFFPDRVLKHHKKEEILLELSEESAPADYRVLCASEPILHFLRQEEIEFIKLLFFGHTHGMMTEFVIRDIGNIKLENLEGHAFTPWFDSHEEAMAVFKLSRIGRAIRELMHAGLPEELMEILTPMNWSNLINFPNARKPADKLMLNLGEYFEKTGYSEEALVYYSLAKKHPCRERQIRIYQKLGRTEEAQDLAHFVLDNPYNASERIFAEDFLSKSGARTLRSTTTRIKQSNEIYVENNSIKKVEEKALDHFRNLGYDGVHTENYLWRNLFGLLFWDELFDATQAVFHHPLQRAPSDLYSRDFYKLRKNTLSKKLESYKTKKQLLKQLTETYINKENINNPLVGWHESFPLTMERCVNLIPFLGLKEVMLEIAKNVKDNSTGFPDLFIWKGKEYHFYEIKSPNDHLSSQQLFWLNFFETHKIKSDILRVNYL